MNIFNVDNFYKKNTPLCQITPQLYRANPSNKREHVEPPNLDTFIF